MARPCEEHKLCKYEYFDYGENTTACLIDFDGDDCPYIKPWSKKKYLMDHNNGFINGNLQIIIDELTH